MPQQSDFLTSFVSKVAAIFMFIITLGGIIYFFRKKSGGSIDQVLNNDNQLADQVNDITNDINQIKEDINNIDTSGMDNDTIADYFNKGK